MANHPRDPCKIAELLQYSCTPNKKNNTVHCLPIPRLFRVCADQTIEVTRVLPIDGDGYVDTHNLSDKLPKGKHWRDVTTFDTSEED
uniref:Uncharacterized protein n=1 Tax=Mycena chlorophos TaxID=658473 RepID=A0ABQ0M111_MYCCL|nr:predicted protein [Mycena chlorophos]